MMGWELNLRLEIKGEEIISTYNQNCCSWSNINKINNELCYLEKCRTISNYFKINLVYPEKYSYTAEEHSELAGVVEIIEGRTSRENSDFNSNPVLTVAFEGVNSTKKLLNQLVGGVEGGKEAIFRATYEPSVLKLLSYELELPPEAHFIQGFQAQMKEDLYQIKIGDKLSIELLPKDNFKFWKEFLFEDSWGEN